MGTHNTVAAEFLGSALLTVSAGLVPLLRVDGLDFALALALCYGLILMLMQDVGVTCLNPCLTLVDILKGHTTGGRGALIMGAEFAGAVVGALSVALVAQDTSGFQSTSGSINIGRMAVSQMAFGTAMVTVYLRGKGRTKFEGFWLAVVFYGASLASGTSTTCLNPAVSFAIDLTLGVTGAAVDERFVVVFVVMPLVAAVVGFLLEKSAEDSLQMSELVGTFVLSYAVFCASSNGSERAALGVGLLSAAVVRAIAPLSGSSFNPAITISSLLSEGRGRVRDVLLFVVFQCGGGILAAAAIKQALSSVPTSAVLTNGSTEALLQTSCLSALLMVVYSVNMGTILGSPAAFFVGGVYGIALVVAKPAIFINPATSIGSFVINFTSTGKVPDPVESAVTVLLPIVASLVTAALMKFVPSECRRNV